MHAVHGLRERLVENQKTDADELEWLGVSPEDQRVMRWQEPIALVLIVLVADLGVFRSGGYAGNAAFLLTATLLFWWGVVARTCSRAVGPVLILLLGVTIRLVWCGSGGAATLGYLLLASWAAALSGRMPYVHVVLSFISETFVSGSRALVQQIYYLGGLSRRLI